MNNMNQGGYFSLPFLLLFYPYKPIYMYDNNIFEYMGTANNSLVKMQDVVNAGGVKGKLLTTIANTQLLKDGDITGKGTGLIGSPLFYNVTLKNEYDNKHLVKFKDLDIEETYPITLGVSLPTTSWTGYTLYGFVAEVTYPNGAVCNNNISITTTTTDKNIEIPNCCDGATVKIATKAFGSSGATISNSLATYNANVAINSIFTIGSGVICTGELGYPCFELTRSFDVIDPVIPPFTGDTGTTIDTRKIDIYISTKNVGLYRLLIQTATFGTGTTLSEVKDYSNLRQAVIPELSKEISGLSISSTAVQATIEVPNDAYVAIYLSDPSGSASNNAMMSLYSWEEDNYQYVPPGNGRASVTYTINTYQIN